MHTHGSRAVGVCFLIPDNRQFIMPIRIKCPKCQTVLGVKESLAGRKANCPKCKFLLTIPKPKAVPAKAQAGANDKALADAEALAASAFADEPVQAAAPQQHIEFEC